MLIGKTKQSHAWVNVGSRHEGFSRDKEKERDWDSGGNLFIVRITECSLCLSKTENKILCFMPRFVSLKVELVYFTGLQVKSSSA